jgi:hypothetical protein
MNAQTKFQQAVAKTKKENWEAMTASIGAFERFSAAGGIELIFGGSIERIKANISNAMDGAMAPITNAINSFVNKIIGQGTPLGDALTVVTNLIADFIDDVASIPEDIIEEIESAETASDVSDAVSGVLNKFTTGGAQFGFDLVFNLLIAGLTDAIDDKFASLPVKGSIGSQFGTPSIPSGGFQEGF